MALFCLFNQLSSSSSQSIIFRHINRTLEEKCFEAATMAASGPVAGDEAFPLFSDTPKYDENILTIELMQFLFSLLFLPAIVALEIYDPLRIQVPKIYLRSKSEFKDELYIDQTSIYIIYIYARHYEKEQEGQELGYY